MKHFNHSSPCCLHFDLRLLGFNLIHTDLASLECPSQKESHSRYALHLDCGLFELSYHSYKHGCL